MKGEERLHPANREEEVILALEGVDLHRRKKPAQNTAYGEVGYWRENGAMRPGLTPTPAPPAGPASNAMATGNRAPPHPRPPYADENKAGEVVRETYIRWVDPSLGV